MGPGGKRGICLPHWGLINPPPLGIGAGDLAPTLGVFLVPSDPLKAPQTERDPNFPEHVPQDHPQSLSEVKASLYGSVILNPTPSQASGPASSSECVVSMHGVENQEKG